MRRNLIWLVLLLSHPAVAQTSGAPAWSLETAPVPRKALVLGVGAYVNVKSLSTPTHDADRMAAVLSGLHFIVTKPSGGMDRKAMLKAVDAYLDTVEPGNIALIYYSGHGVERDGVNYILPADVPPALTKGREGHQAISLDWLMDESGKKEAGLTILVLDACRDDPFTPPPGPGGVTGPKGLAEPPQYTTGFFVGFAAAPRALSFSRLEGDDEDLPSIFTRKLVERLGDPGRSLYGVWSVVGKQVYDMTNFRQKPWHNASLFPELKLVPSAADVAEEQNAWDNAILASTPANLRADLNTFLENYPVSDHAIAARKKIAEIDATQVTGDRNALEALQRYVEVNGSLVEPSSVILTGSVTNSVRSTGAAASYGAFSAAFALSTAAQSVRASPSSTSRSVGTLATGSPVAVIGSPQGAGRWSKVLLPTGRVGYLPGVEVFKPRAEKAVELVFGTGSATPSDPAPARTAAAELKGKAGRISIAVGAAGVPLEDRARTLAYLRALAVRGELVRSGVSADRIDVTFRADPALAKDTARLLVRYQ